MNDDGCLGRVDSQHGRASETDRPFVDTLRGRVRYDHVIRRESSVLFREERDRALLIFLAVCFEKLADHDVPRRNDRIKIAQCDLIPRNISLEVRLHLLESGNILLRDPVGREDVVIVKELPFHIHVHIVVVDSPDDVVDRHGKMERPLVINYVPAVPDNHIIKYHIDIGHREGPCSRCGDIPKNADVIICPYIIGVRGLDQLIEVFPKRSDQFVRTLKKHIHMFLEHLSLKELKGTESLTGSAPVRNEPRLVKYTPESLIAVHKTVYMR